MNYSVHEAKAKLSRLLKEACSGREVIIVRGRKPIAKLVPLGSACKKRVPNKFAGQISYTPDAFEPL